MDMQYLELALAIGGSVVAVAVGYGIAREKISQLERKCEENVKDAEDDLALAIAESKADRKEIREELRALDTDGRQERREIREEMKLFVTHSHLDAVIEPIRKTLNVVEKDVKEILRTVSN